MRKSPAAVASLPSPPPSPPALAQPTGDNSGNARVCTSGASAPGLEKATLMAYKPTGEGTVLYAGSAPPETFYYRPFLL